MDKKKILIVDDDRNICDLLRIYLEDAGYETHQCYDGRSALEFLKGRSVDLVLLDIMLPGIDGWEVCKAIRLNSRVPVILLTARDMLEDKLQGFEAGADDYIVKPFQPREVVARIGARLRDGSKAAPCPEGTGSALEIGNLRVDMGRYEARLGGEPVALKPKEVQLLYFLMQNPHRVFTREQLLEKVWGYRFTGETRTVDVHIKRLREKLGSETDGWAIRTVWGVGYKFEVLE